MNGVESHPLQPFLPPDARLLMLGSFPPSRRRWCMDFFYPNFINDMWRIFGLVFFGDKERFVDVERSVFRREDIMRFLEEKGVALYDTACAVRRTKNTASDKDLEIVTPTDIDALLRRIPSCVAVATTGQKATDVFTSHFGMRQPKVGTSEPFTFEGRQMRLYRMPSSSRAYPMKVENKAAYYEKMFEEIGLKD
jgi:G:T/U-mismatch repair DNA glycosylase